MLSRVHTARDGQPHELEAVVRLAPVLARDDPSLHRPHGALEVDRSGKRLRRELLLFEVRQEPLRVQEHGMRAERDDDRHARFEKEAAEVGGLSDVVIDDPLVDRFANSLPERLMSCPAMPP
jgi:hypothetical protein